MGDAQHLYTRRGALAAAALTAATPAHAQLGTFINKLTNNPNQPTAATPPPSQPSMTAGVHSIVPRGYSEDFVPVRGLIGEGRYPEAIARFTPSAAGAGSTGPGPIVSDVFLANAERGLIEFESGSPDTAATHLRVAEDSYTTRRDAKGLKAAGNFIGDIARSAVGTVTGQKGVSDYHPLDHERVLQLNYLSLALLLQGERRCYNITRRCIEEQGVLKERFDKELEDFKSKYAQKTDDTEKVTVADRNAIDGLANQFKAYDNDADRVPNAYVNPLGDYLAGVIQEIVSYEQPALRDNSRIAYLNAMKLCGRSAQLSAAATAMARDRVPPNERILHVIVGEGFAPQREVMTFGLSLKGQVVPVRVPIFKPTPSTIAKIVVRSSSGATLTTLDPIGDFEAIRLRDQHDRIPEIMLDVFTSSLASYFTGQATKNLGAFGSWVTSMRENSASPDTRSWLSLPRRFHVARLTLPPQLHGVEIAAYDQRGRRLSSQTTPLPASETQSVLYGRATHEGLKVQAARRLWIEGRLEETPS